MFNIHGPISVNIILIMLEGPLQYINKHGLKLVLAIPSPKWWPYEMVAQIVKLHKQERFLHELCSQHI